MANERTDSCLKTKVRNICGHERFFGYLPNGGYMHGKRLRDNEEYEFYGNLLDTLSGKSRFLTSLSRDISDGHLVILSTPSPHFYDPENDQTQILKINDGALLQDDPCWGRYVSSDAHDV